MIRIVYMSDYNLAKKHLSYSVYKFILIKLNPIRLFRLGHLHDTFLLRLAVHSDYLCHVHIATERFKLYVSTALYCMMAHKQVTFIEKKLSEPHR